MTVITKRKIMTAISARGILDQEDVLIVDFLSLNRNKIIKAILDSDVVCGYEKPLKTASLYIQGKSVIQLKWKEQQKYVDAIIDLYEKGYNIVYLFTGD